MGTENVDISIFNVMKKKYSSLSKEEYTNNPNYIKDEELNTELSSLMDISETSSSEKTMGNKSTDFKSLDFNISDSAYYSLCVIPFSNVKYSIGSKNKKYEKVYVNNLNLSSDSKIYKNEDKIRISNFYLNSNSELSENYIEIGTDLILGKNKLSVKNNLISALDNLIIDFSENNYIKFNSKTDIISDKYRLEIIKNTSENEFINFYYDDNKIFSFIDNYFVRKDSELNGIYIKLSDENQVITNNKITANKFKTDSVYLTYSKKFGIQNDSISTGITIDGYDNGSKEDVYSYVLYNTSNHSLSPDKKSYVCTNNPTFVNKLTVNTNSVFINSTSFTSYSGIAFLKYFRNYLVPYMVSNLAPKESPVFLNSVTVSQKVKINNINSYGTLIRNSENILTTNYEYRLVDSEGGIIAPLASPKFTGTVNFPNKFHIRQLRKNTYNDISSGFLKYSSSVISSDDFSDIVTSKDPVITGTITMTDSFKFTISAAPPPGSTIPYFSIKYAEPLLYLYTNSSTEKSYILTSDPSQILLLDSPEMSGNVTLPSSVKISDYTNTGYLYKSGNSFSVDSNTMRKKEIPFFYKYHPSSSDCLSTGSCTKYSNIANGYRISHALNGSTVPTFLYKIYLPNISNLGTLRLRFSGCYSSSSASSITVYFATTNDSYTNYTDFYNDYKSTAKTFSLTSSVSFQYYNWDTIYSTSYFYLGFKFAGGSSESLHIIDFLLYTK